MSFIGDLVDSLVTKAFEQTEIKNFDMTVLSEGLQNSLGQTISHQASPPFEAHEIFPDLEHFTSEGECTSLYVDAWAQTSQSLLSGVATGQQHIQNSPMTFEAAKMPAESTSASKEPGTLLPSKRVRCEPPPTDFRMSINEELLLTKNKIRRVGLSKRARPPPLHKMR